LFCFLAVPEPLATEQNKKLNWLQGLKSIIRSQDARSNRIMGSSRTIASFYRRDLEQARSYLGVMKLNSQVGVETERAPVVHELNR
jgi:hypothetical protein